MTYNTYINKVFKIICLYKYDLQNSTRTNLLSLTASSKLSSVNTKTFSSVSIAFTDKSPKTRNTNDNNFIMSKSKIIYKRLS